MGRRSSVSRQNGCSILVVRRWNGWGCEMGDLCSVKLNVDRFNNNMIMNLQKKQTLIDYLGMIMTMFGIVIIFYYKNLVSTLFLWNVLNKDISYLLFRAQFIISMLGLLIIIIGIIFIFHKIDQLKKNNFTSIVKLI
jgi:hypothetical protein